MTIRNSLIPIEITKIDNQGFLTSASGGENSYIYNIFNGTYDGTANNYYRSSIVPKLPEYLTVIFPKKYEIDGYTVFIGYSYVQYVNMKRWDFEVLIDGVWSIAHSGSNDTQVSNILTYSFTPIMVDGIRIKCIERWGTNSWGIDALNIYEYKPNIKSLIKDLNNIKILSEGVWVDTGLIEPLTKVDYETHGMDDLSIIPYEKWNELDDEFEVITWTDEKTVELIGQLNGVKSKWTEEGKLFETLVNINLIKLDNVINRPLKNKALESMAQTPNTAHSVNTIDKINNGIINDKEGFLETVSAKEVIIWIDLLTRQKIKKVSMVNFLYGAGYRCKDFEIISSNDLNVITTLEKGVLIDNALVQNFNVSNEQRYRYWGVKIKSGHISNSSYGLSQLQLWGDETIGKILVSSQNKVQHLSGLGEWQELSTTGTPTKADFEIHGMSDLSIISKEKLAELTKPYSILTWTNDETATKTALDYTYEQYKSKWIDIETETFSPLERLNNEGEFEVLTYSDENEILPKQSTGIVDTIDSGRLFKTTIEDLITITGVETL